MYREKVMVEMTDSRDRGILSPTDRKFVKGEKEYNHRQTASDRRKEIRERLYNSLLDLSLIFNHMDEDEVARVFSPDDTEQQAFVEALTDGLGMIYRETFPATTIPAFKTLLSAGVSRAERQIAGSDGLGVSVTFDVERSSPVEFDLDEIGEKIRLGKTDEIPVEALRIYTRYYARSDEFDPEIPQQVLETRRDEVADEYNEAVERRAKTRMEKRGTDSEYAEQLDEVTSPRDEAETDADDQD